MKKLKEILSKSTKKQRIGVLCGILVVTVAIIALVAKNSLADSNSSILKDQKIGNLSFESAKIEKTKKGYEFTVNIYNEGPSKQDIDNLTIVFIDDDKDDFKVYLDDVHSLESFEGRQITVIIEKDITKADGIKYVINKK